MTEIVDTTQELAEELARLPRGAAARIKQVLRAGLEASWVDARKHELRALVEFGQRGRERDDEERD